jgi:UDP-GlcNAc3NAcA epimerase
MKIITIVGARPQFVKAAVLSRMFKGMPQVEEIIIHTGQHFDERMSDIFFKEMDIPMPQYNLNINGLTHGAMTGQMIEGIERILLKELPDMILVYGDTNSTLAGAIAASKIHIPVVHVEAGLRSFNMRMPEEQNRILTDRLSKLLCCPTNTAIDNLKKEGFENYDCTIINTGDVMEDAALYYAERADSISTIIKDLNLEINNYVLGTIHRAENTDSETNLRDLISAYESISKEMRVIIPMHPRTRNIINQMGIKPKFEMIEPVGYFDMIKLIQNSRLVITDSGGLQKEAYFFRKYCITTREQTEWVELIENNFNYLSGTNTNLIVELFQNLSTKKFPEGINLYGNGKAAENICNAILAI